MRAAAGARRKSSAREAHLTGALGHGRFDAGAKMTDKRVASGESNRVRSWEIMHRRFPPREPFKSRGHSRNVKDFGAALRRTR